MISVSVSSAEVQPYAPGRFLPEGTVMVSAPVIMDAGFSYALLFSDAGILPSSSIAARTVT